MNQAHRKVKPFTSIDGTSQSVLGANKSNVPVLPQPNGAISFTRRGSSSSSTNTGSNSNNALQLQMPVPSPILRSGDQKVGSNNSFNNDIIFTDNTRVGQVQKVYSNEKLLLRRIQELENQNDKLLKHISATDKEIRNYRGFISSRDSTGNSTNTGNNSNGNGRLQQSCKICDNGTTIEQLQSQLLESQKRLAMTLSQQSSSRHHHYDGNQSQVQVQPSLRQQVQGQTQDIESLAVVKNLRQTLSSMEGQLKLYKKQASEYKQQIATMTETDVASASVKTTVNSSAVPTTKAKAPDIRLQLQEYTMNISTLKSAHADQVTSVKNELNNFNDYIKITILPELLKLTYVIEKKENENSTLKLALNINDKHIITKDIEIKELKNEINDNNIKYDELKKMYENLEKNILAKTDTATATAHAVAEVLAKAATVNTDTPQKNKNKNDVYTPDKNTIQQLEQYELLIKQLEIKNKSIINEREKYFKKYHKLYTTIANIMKTISTLENSHNDVIKTVKHSAHVKDLKRVASSREMLLEKDKALSNEIYLNEINNILTFCLKTVETTLLETSPQIVIRVAEGRNKRLKLLEKGNYMKNRDIEQRSKETLAIGSSALEGFQIKADNKAKEAIQVWTNTLNSLNKICESIDTDTVAGTTDTTE
jgi:hypothetical protein